MRTVIRMEDGLGAHVEVIADSDELITNNGLFLGAVKSMHDKLNDPEQAEVLTALSTDPYIVTVVIYFRMLTDGIIWQHTVPAELNMEQVEKYLETIYGSVATYSRSYDEVFNS